LNKDDFCVQKCEHIFFICAIKYWQITNFRFIHVSDTKLQFYNVESSKDWFSIQQN
jgi:hypothetical protein